MLSRARAAAGLIVYLAQVGSFVPAVAASLSPVDLICTRIASCERWAAPVTAAHVRADPTARSVSVAASTFTIDAAQMARMLRMATPRSLLLIDEFGKGTSTAGGWRCAGGRRLGWGG